MNKQNKTKGIILAVAIVITMALLGGYAVVGNRSTESKYVLDKNLQNIVDSAKTWDVAFTSWFGKSAPDFTVKDINGKSHKLSDYRGKNVLVVFWATWCPPCNQEIPHLIELRNTFGEDELAILAISTEDSGLVKSFAESKQINYTVVSLDDSILPQPFASVTSIPTSFYIDRNGAVKLATEGLVSFEDAKAIIQTEK